MNKEFEGAINRFAPELIGPEHKTAFLVATNIPDGIIVHAELGVFRDPAGKIMSDFQKAELLRSNIKNMRPILASKVGLEWRDHRGQKIQESDKWANESYVIISDEK